MLRRVPPIPAWILASLLLVATEGGCADHTAILVEVTSADLAVPTEVNSLTIRAISTFGSMYEQTFSLGTSWPHSLTILPAAREGIGWVRIEVTGSHDGTFVVRRVVTTEFIPGMVRRVSVVLPRDCIGVMCGDAVDCIGGTCVGEIDGGMVDAGLADAGPVDAPMTDMDAMLDAGSDAGPGDAGTDAPIVVDAGFDAGFDGGSDSGVDAPPFDAGPGGIYFSEYVEGSGTSNKAFEIYNASSTTLDLSTCTVGTYVNGAASSTNTIVLTGTLAPGAVVVVCHGSAVAPLMPLCDILGPTSSSGALAFNGDDAVELVCGGITVDVIGQIGVDPGTQWGTSSFGTADHTLRRNCTVTFGDTNGADAFDPTAEWSAFPQDTFDGLGTRGCP